jgi:hypothetical protein
MHVRPQAQALSSLLNSSNVCDFLGCAAPPLATTNTGTQWRRLSDVAHMSGALCSAEMPSGSGREGAGCSTSGPPYAAALRNGVVSVLTPDGFVQTTNLSDAAVAQGTRAGSAGWSSSQAGNYATDDTWYGVPH